jgi:hypothetical protein
MHGSESARHIQDAASDFFVDPRSSVPAPELEALNPRKIEGCATGTIPVHSDN